MLTEGDCSCALCGLAEFPAQGHLCLRRCFPPLLSQGVSKSLSLFMSLACELKCGRRVTGRKLICIDSLVSGRGWGRKGAQRHPSHTGHQASVCTMDWIPLALLVVSHYTGMNRAQGSPRELPSCSSSWYMFFWSLCQSNETLSL